MSLTEGQVFAGFTVVRPLGSGGMGEVHLARHPRLPRQDALKVLPESVSADEEFRARFNREADLAATLWHPHIVGVHDRGEYEGRFVDLDGFRGRQRRGPAVAREVSGGPRRDEGRAFIMPSDRRPLLRAVGETAGADDLGALMSRCSAD